MAVDRHHLANAVANACPAAAPARFCDGEQAVVVAAALEALACDHAAVLAIVLQTEGSTYTREGTLTLFDGDDRVGWISGGCLEPEIQDQAALASRLDNIVLLEIDTRDDASMMSGSALGCRGRQLLALVPLRPLGNVGEALDAWLHGGGDLHLSVDRHDGFEIAIGGFRRQWRLPVRIDAAADGQRDWHVSLPRPPVSVILGAGPELTMLGPLLRGLGWRLTVVEPRARWRSLDGMLDFPPRAALVELPEADAALVMHHNFEMDLEALGALASTSIPFVGLLGPRRRRNDLFRLLQPRQRESLQARLRAPVGLDLGGRGPQAIALSIAAQLQSWRCSD